MAFNYSPKIITDGLVLYLDAANNKSYPGIDTNWYDLSKEGNNGVLQNGPSFNSENSGNISTNGINEYIDCLDSSSLNLNNLTLDVWVKPLGLPDPSQGSGLICKGISTDGNSGSYELVLVQSGGKNYSYFRIKKNAAPTAFCFPLITPIEIGEISNIVCTYDNVEMKIYVNSIQEGTSTFTTGILELNSDNLTLGVRTVHAFLPNNSQLYGRIYSSKIYNRALSQEEIAKNYNAVKSRFGL